MTYMTKIEIEPSVVASKAATRKAVADQQRVIRLEDADHFDRTRVGERLRPTRQTEARLLRCPVATLVESGALSVEQGRASEEIHEVYVGILGGLLSHAALSERKERGKGDMAERLADRHANHYLPWATYLGGRSPFRDLPAVIGTCQPALELTIDVVIDGATLAGCAAKFHCHHSFAREMLRYSLSVYAGIAGWEDNRQAVTAFEIAWKHKGKRYQAA